MKLTEQQIREAIETSQSMREAASRFPINFKTFRSYAQKLGIYTPNQSGIGIHKPRPKISLDSILSGEQPQYHTYSLKQRLIKEKGWQPVCSSCGLSSWLDGAIPLELDHIDGNPYNHREDNLRLLCPNCHALTDTYRAKNKKKPPEGGG